MNFQGKLVPTLVKNFKLVFKNKQIMFESAAVVNYLSDVCCRQATGNVLIVL
jgi:hypothetical protein